ncbi:MAG: glycosyltransferase family 9 protein [Bacteroidia bacterium]|nr:glycosyltransferase family 9 protein [Bacteroidia bacterium]
MNYSVFISEGIGDAILLVPLIKELRKTGSVTGIFDSAPDNYQLFEITDLFDNKIRIQGDSDYFKLALTYFNKFDVAYLNFLASSRKNLILSTFISKNAITNHIPENLSGIFKRRIHFVEPCQETHDSVQNLRMLEGHKEEDLNSLFQVQYDLDGIELNTPFADNSNIIAVQISAGNNVQRYKNWVVENWIDFLKLASEKFPDHKFVLVGHKGEKELAETILEKEITNVMSMIGETNIPQAIKLLNSCSLFLGLDGGLMHLAVSLNKPTFTLWGQSDPDIYGYEKINAEMHKVIQDSGAKRHSWLNPIHDFDYQDNSAMQLLKPADVFEEFSLFASKFL